MAVLKENESKQLSGCFGVGPPEKEMHPVPEVPWVLAADNKMIVDRGWLFVAEESDDQ